jgi:hypothetical protein
MTEKIKAWAVFGPGGINIHSIDFDQEKAIKKHTFIHAIEISPKNVWVNYWSKHGYTCESVTINREVEGE